MYSQSAKKSDLKKILSMEEGKLFLVAQEWLARKTLAQRRCA